MKAPKFWYSPPCTLSRILHPLGWLYGKGGKILQRLKTPERFSIPILSVGNIVCGGAGKTPTALALAHLLQKKGLSVHFVTRGYGGQQKGPLSVNPSQHTFKDVGDEPLLLAQQASTWVAKERPAGVKKAIEHGAHLVILDDGHQTSSLYKDLSFVVLDELQGFGNGDVIPAGPLREPLDEGIQRTDGFILIGDKSTSLYNPLFKAKRVSRPFKNPSKKIVAFCGLGFPEKFYQTLKEQGMTLVSTKSFPDHYAYTPQDLRELQALAQSKGTPLVTTRKDILRVPPSWQTNILVLDIDIQFEDEERIYQFIAEKIPSLKEER